MVRLTAAAIALLTLAACQRSPADRLAASPAAPARPRSGEELYVANCRGCHLADGSAVRYLRPGLAGSAVVNGDPDILASWVLFGVHPPGWLAGRYPPVMPAYAHLSDDDAASLLTYVRSHFGNASTAIDAAAIARLRAARH